MSVEVVSSEVQDDSDLQARLDRIPFRTPVDDNDDRDPKKVDKQWRATTEAIRRAVLTNPDTRSGIIGFIDRPLDEKLPDEVLNKITEVDERTKRFVGMGSAVMELLKLDSVPAELIDPDIKKAPDLVTRAGVERMMKIYEKAGFDTRQRVEGLREEVLKQPGISKAEKNLVATRYRYARDVKLLALMAELHDNPFYASEPDNDGVVSYNLPSGTKLGMTTEVVETIPTLLDPQHWESREQLKDRVYRIVIKGKSYIMKERKTSRHMHTMRSGHWDGLTSAQEFRVARHFSELGPVRRDDVELHWEKPLGYVRLPDGYQFCLFEEESGLGYNFSEQLEQEIMASKEEYAEEFAKIQQRAKEIYDSEEYDLWGERGDVRIKPKWFNITSDARRKRKLYKSLPAPDELTFEEFSKLKALSLFPEARDLLSEITLSHGYIDHDSNQYAFRLRKGKRPTLEIIRFDYEYSVYSPEEAERRMRYKADSDQSGYSALSRLQDQRTTIYERMIASAASYAMVEKTGLTIPPRQSEPRQL